jgi:hypothetical protein
MPEHEQRRDGEAFVPTGAIAFFAAMLLFYGAFWIALYALLVLRA